MIQEFAERKEGIASSTLRAGRQRLGNVAAQLSRRGAMKARAELCNEAVGVAIRLCYESDTGGGPANVDSATGRILIPLPWGEKGHRAYGLRSTEQRALRAYMQDLQNHKPAGAPIFCYDPLTRCWYLNYFDHNSASALAYWQRWGMTEAAYKERLR
jgi:hypothetical protein